MVVVEANIDDMNPEIYESVMESLFRAGAVDVFLTPIMMKKNRPANMLTALSSPEYLESLVEIFFQETTSIGLRINRVEKRFLPRKMEEVITPWGPVQAKVCYWQGEKMNQALEYSDCKRLSRETGVSVKRIYQNAGKNQE